jgi:hypothetical protein
MAVEILRQFDHLYDGNDHPTRLTDRKGQVTHYQYDGATMSINARLETRHEKCLVEVPDPRGNVNLPLSLASLDATVCLKFIDPYGDTVFNALQIPVLLLELEAIAPLVTETSLRAEQAQHLNQIAAWPAAAREAAQKHSDSLSLDELRGHLAKLIELARDGASQGAHHYCRFIGD